MKKESNTMSDTPRLDSWIYQGPLPPLQEFAILARQIERELNAANDAMRQDLVLMWNDKEAKP